MVSTGKQQELAKANLRKVLAEYEGNTKHEAVVTAIQKLCAVNPLKDPARSGQLLEGEWVLISAPNFPEGERQEDGKYRYTLGRLAFNMFQPVDLKIVIDRVLQPVFLVDNGEQRTHDIIVEFTTVGEDNQPILRGIVRNLGVCEPMNDETLKVKFTGGILAPQTFDNIETWKTVFKQSGQSSRRSLKEKIMFNLFKLMLGLVPPKEMNPETGEVSFKMKRSPQVSLNILYLDEELRITCGDKGTILVCERGTGL